MPRTYRKNAQVYWIFSFETTLLVSRREGCGTALPVRPGPAAAQRRGRDGSPGHGPDLLAVLGAAETSAEVHLETVPLTS